MPTTEITFEMMLNEIRRVHKIMVDTYPRLVEQRKLDPYTRDHRLNVWAKIEKIFNESNRAASVEAQKLYEQQTVIHIQSRLNQFTHEQISATTD